MKSNYIFLILLFFATSCYAGIKTGGKYNLKVNPNPAELQNPITTNNEETLFILDYSNSMNEYLNEKTKYEMLIESMKIILTKIPLKNKLGVRLYGQRWGLTPIDACKATKLVVPVGLNSAETVFSALARYSPKGMTPITYSIKQALLKDFSKDTSTPKHIILITDGGENCDESPCTYAMELIKHRHDVVIDVIAFNMYDQDDLDQLECVAKVTKGKFYSADTKAELIRGINNAYRTQKNVDAKILTH